MTIVIAKRRGNDFLILSDTMIGDARETQPDVMPGRLKTVCLGDAVTVSFAGNADLALLAVRTARKVLKRDGPLAVIEFLKASSQSKQVDFICATHKPTPALWRIIGGVALNVPDICSLGNDTEFRDLIDEGRLEDGPEALHNSNLRLRFSDKLLRGSIIAETVGGFPIALVAKPDGHSYCPMGSFYTYKFPIMKWGETTYQSIDQVYSGDGHFQFQLLKPALADTPVLAACLEQARMGYIYSPMEDAKAFPVQLFEHNAPWEGRSQDMFKRLYDVMAEHVARVEFL